MNQKTETLVIGGGAIGICCAYYLHQHGKKVAVIEKGEICSGASHGNAGLIVPSHSIPLAAPGVITQGLKWMFDPQSPFYIKPRLDHEFLSWLWKFNSACSEANVRRALPVMSRLNAASLNWRRWRMSNSTLKKKAWSRFLKPAKGWTKGSKKPGGCRNTGSKAGSLTIKT